MADEKSNGWTLKTEKPKQNHTGKILLAIVAAFVIIFILKPGLEGYGIYRQVEKTNYSLEDYTANLQDLKLELSTTKSNLSLHAQFNQELQEQLSATSAQLTSCQGERATIEANLNSCTELCDGRTSVLQQQLITVEKSLSDAETKKNEAVNSAAAQCTETQEQLKKIQANYDLLLKNSARSICCKQKVDNPDISAYTVLEQKIICVEEGGITLDCT